MVKTYSYAKDGATQLTPHFKVREFRSFNDATGKLTSYTILIDESLPAKLEELFSYLGCSKIIVTSGYRSEDFEIVLSGKVMGQHVTGKAADIKCYDKAGAQIDPKRVCCAAEQVGFHGIGYMAHGTHVDVRDSKSFFDETKSFKTLSSFYDYFGIARPQAEPVAVAKAEPVVTAAAQSGVLGIKTLKPGIWNIRKGPGTNYPIARTVKGNQTVTYVDIVNGWYKLRDGTYVGPAAVK